MGLGTLYGGSEETEFLVRQLCSNFQVFYMPSWLLCHKDRSLISYTFRSMHSYGLGRGYLYRAYLKRKPFWILYHLSGISSPILPELYLL